jgi:dynein assembly factor with WDR repeat domains 1
MIGKDLKKDAKTLQRILVRFYPPGIILEFLDSDGMLENKSIDLLNLSEK